MVTLTSLSPADTLALGRQWAAEASPGWVFGLTGDLGAGKTQLVKGLAQGLGITERVQSPTFALVNEYRSGRWPLFHLDLYRLETPEQIHSAGLEEYLFPSRGITVVEWFERVPESLRGAPAGLKLGHSVLRHAWLEVLNDLTRRISYEDSGT